MNFKKWEEKIREKTKHVNTVSLGVINSQNDESKGALNADEVVGSVGLLLKPLATALLRKKLKLETNFLKSMGFL